MKKRTNTILIAAFAVVAAGGIVVMAILRTLVTMS
jgi:hypothetical protein